MLPLVEIHRMAATVDAEWRSPVADTVATTWGLPPGLARWWRSSASHVFVLPATPHTPRSYLRFTPDDVLPAHRARAVAAWMRSLRADGVAVVEPRPSSAGRDVETVTTDLGVVHAVVVSAAPGEEVDADALTVERATAWGAALAAVHRGPPDDAVAGALPDADECLDRAAAVLHDDPAVRAAAARVRARLAELPRTPSTYGPVHGDFELDNLAWADGTATSFDYDGAHRSWYVADLASAARDLLADGARPAPGHRAHLRAFLAGYLTVRPELEPELRHLELFARAGAVVSLARLTTVLTAAEPPAPDVLPDLRERLVALAARQRALVLGT